jgi:hypothetical protein
MSADQGGGKIEETTDKRAAAAGMEKVNPKLSNIVSLFRSSNCGHNPLADFADHETTHLKKYIALHYCSWCSCNVFLRIRASKPRITTIALQLEKPRLTFVSRK